MRQRKPSLEKGLWSLLLTPFAARRRENWLKLQLSGDLGNLLMRTKFPELKTGAPAQWVCNNKTDSHLSVWCHLTGRGQSQWSWSTWVCGWRRWVEWPSWGCLSQTVMTYWVSPTWASCGRTPQRLFSYEQALLSTSFSCVPREEALCLFFFPSVRTLQRLFICLGIKKSN